jgi:hypothetical protein
VPIRSLKMVKDYKEAFDLIESYDALVKRALEITRYEPYYAYIENRDSVHIDLDGDQAILSWWFNEGDHTGGPWLKDEAHAFPAKLLFEPCYSEFKDEMLKVAIVEKEKSDRLRKAQAAVERQRKEEAEKAEYIRLSAKYGKPVV